MTKRSKPAGDYTQRGYVPGDDPAQDEHNKHLASLTDEQTLRLADAIEQFMDRKAAEAAAQTGTKPARSPKPKATLPR